MKNNHVQTAQGKSQHNYKRVRPLIDIYESDDEVLLRADMPGVCKEDLHIQFVDDKIEISGIRKLESAGRQTWQEFEDIEYTTSLKVTKDLDGAGAQAEFSNGVLNLRLTRVQEAQPKKILVQ